MNEVFPLNSLLSIGFLKVGYWSINLGKLTFSIQIDRQLSNFLYAFVCGTELKYIGKSNSTLYQRMNGYRNPGPSQRTNIRIHAEILQSIRSGLPVEIFVFSPKETIQYRNIELDLISGLENPLIKLCSPEWNIMARENSHWY